MIVLTFAIALTGTQATAHPVTSNAPEVVGTLVIAHGGGPEWNALIEEVAQQVELDGPVEISYLMGPAAKTHRFQQAASRLVSAGATRIVVVPVLVSSHSGHYEQIRWLAGEVDTLSETMMHHLHMAGIERADVAVPIHVAPAMDDSPEVARVLAERARELAPDPGGRALFLIGHGPNSAEDHAEWMSNLRRIAREVEARTGFEDVKVGLVQDDAPAHVRAEAVSRIREIIQLQYAVTNQPVVVVPVLVSRGSVSDEKLPKDLEGLPVIYSGEALLPHSGMARWIEARVRNPQK